MLLGRSEIQVILPHRDPMLLVDRLIHYDKDSAMAELDIAKDHCAGHFDIFPGVHIVESLAQACGLLAYCLAEGQTGGQTPFLRGIDGVCFKAQVTPGDTLRLQVKLTKALNGLKKFSGDAFVGDKLAARVKEIAIYLGE